MSIILSPSVSGQPLVSGGPKLFGHASSLSGIKSSSLSLLMKYFPKDFHPFIPGLEMKLAIESGEKNGAKIIYGGITDSKDREKIFFPEKFIHNFIGFSYSFCL
jgi:hypothetical protein